MSEISYTSNNIYPKQYTPVFTNQEVEMDSKEISFQYIWPSPTAQDSRLSSFLQCITKLAVSDGFPVHNIKKLYCVVTASVMLSEYGIL